MNAKQLTLENLKGLILRLFPGLAGYHVVRYALVKKVYEDSGLDTVLNPIMMVDLQLCKHDFSIDRKHNIKKKVRLAGGSEFVQAPPSEGTYVLIHFPYWMCNTATVLAVLYLNRMLKPEQNCYQVRDAEKTKISAKSELVLGEGNDQAVLGLELNTKLETLIDKMSALGDQVVALGAGGTVSGGALNAAGAVTTAINGIKVDLTIVKNTLDDVLSTIKIGLGTDASST